MNIGIIGGGASGTLCAIELAKLGFNVTIIEKNEKIGKKLYITGKGRCNLTNDCLEEEFLSSVIRNPKFLYSAIYTFNSQSTMEYFENLGLRLKTERGNRVFPVSDKSSDVLKALSFGIKKYGVKLNLNEEVDAINKIEDKFEVVTNKAKYKFDKVVIATGGKTYASTGSTGDGYIFAKGFSHTIVEPCGTLLGLRTKTNLNLSGLSLKNVELSAKLGKKVLFKDFGELLFTHDGVSGPLVITASSVLARKNLSELNFTIDLKPALSFEKLDARILRDFEENINKNFRYAITKLLPSSMIDVVIKLANIPQDKKVNLITKQERENLVNILKNFPLDVTGTVDQNNGIITCGGVKVNEVSPSTLMSKLCDNLYFIGEVLDVDAKTGGFNLQIAFATAILCARSIEDERFFQKQI